MSKAFFSTFFPLEFVYIVDYINRYLYIEMTLHPCDEGYLIMVYYHFDAFLDSCIRLARILLSIFVSMFIKEIGLKFSFLIWSLFGFGLGISVIVAS